MRSASRLDSAYWLIGPGSAGLAALICLTTTTTSVLSILPYIYLDEDALDKFWQQQDILYDYKVELTGVGNRSQINTDDNVL